ncbi:MAG TPA: hypothetical protein DEO33_03590 [Rikenellaceae bacterium]|nr:hypothetical protein [Rikenellaceae bacterium]
MKTIGIIGTRKKTSEQYYKIVEEEFLKHYEKGDMICSGLCPRSADMFALRLSNAYKTEILWFPAKRNKCGRSVSFKRNIYIALNSDILIALVSDDRIGGTEDIIRKFIKFHKEDKLIIIK